MKKNLYLLLSLIAVSSSVVLVSTRPTAPRVVTPGCSVTALDVGQGDALLIQTSDHQDILIDGGPGQAVVEELSTALPFGDRDIELMVLTHPHADHVNGLVAVTERYTVRRVLETAVTYHQQAYEHWHDLLRQQNIPDEHAVSGQRLVLGQATLDVLWPANDLSSTTIDHDNASEGGGVNDASIVLRLLCAGSRAIFTGDASSDIEDRILDGGADVSASLLKVGHHGSRFSTSQRWLQTVKPTWAVISVGQGNRYNHPHPTTMQRLQQNVPHILRTDEEGSITLQTDGRQGWQLGGVDKSKQMW